MITVPSNTLNDINNNIFVGGTATYLHTNGTACDDGNATTTGETWLNDEGQLGLGNKIPNPTPQKIIGTTSYEKTCEDGFTLEETTGRCWQDKQ